MTSHEIRRAFLEFFKSKRHTIVPSSSLLPDSPNLLFTNAGMNQFVPILTGERKCPFNPPRAADTQKCIRAGGKHNDLEDVGYDTFHHTLFEMLGNWSFGDYFKRETIQWAWELLTGVWGFPKERLYATVYKPNTGNGDPGETDHEAREIWASVFEAAGLDANKHVLYGDKKDNFWMMGDTGPCGPCSEIHLDLTPGGDTGGSLVNADDPRCMEVWNLVFMQLNANPDGSYSPLPANNVDTGMGFERVVSIIQGTKNFTDFSKAVSNYDTDVFRPLFDKLERLSGHRYMSTLPGKGVAPSEQQKVDIAFRVIADHIRTLSLAIADGIQPANTDRNYVLRRILRRAVRYGRTLGFHKPFFFELTDVVADTMGDVFPEVRKRGEHVREIIRREEETFNRTLDRGIDLFEETVRRVGEGSTTFPAEDAFRLYDTYGFPLDLTELMARERGLCVDRDEFERHMDQQRSRARAARREKVIEISQVDIQEPTEFVGYDSTAVEANVIESIQVKGKRAVALDVSPCYAEMGGQVGDTGVIRCGGHTWEIVDTQKVGDAFLHFISGDEFPEAGARVELVVDKERRAAIQRHHTVTHLLHWALRKVVGDDVVQKGSFVGSEKITFDFSAMSLSPEQVKEVERLVNLRILENQPVTWKELPFDEVQKRPEIIQIFGEKYEDTVRVVQIGGESEELDGFSMELCGGTHVRATGEIGMFRIINESAVAAGIRRIEAVAGLHAYRCAVEDRELLEQIANCVNSPVNELARKVENLIARNKELDKQLRSLNLRRAQQTASELMEKPQLINSVPAIICNLGVVDGAFVHTVAESLKSGFNGVAVLGGADSGAVSLISLVSKEYADRINAGRIIKEIAPSVGGKGGGKPEFARGGGKNPDGLDDALALARKLIK
ncbi:MAG: alanine--tRNA ligase [Verrucomicrobia bacterium]|nr:alanine--tRNA ligase [Verrucomicrobiota bacterium]